MDETKEEQLMLMTCNTFIKSQREETFYCKNFIALHPNAEPRLCLLHPAACSPVHLCLRCMTAQYSSLN